MSTLKTELYEVIGYTRKMIPKIRDIVNDLFGVIPPKIDIIFGQPTVLNTDGIDKVGINIEGLYGVHFFGDKFLERYPYILHNIPSQLVFLNKVRKSLAITINPTHYSIVSLSEEYSHYVFDWIHNFEKIEEERQLRKLIAENIENSAKRTELLVKLCIIKGKWEAIGEIVEGYIINTFDYSDDFESVSFLKERIRRMVLAGSFQEAKFWNKVFAITHTLGAYYAETIPKDVKEFQQYVRKNPFIVTKKDIIEAKIVIETELF